jgi:DNA-binding beta-propeller fold protein YncE
MDSVMRQVGHKRFLSVFYLLFFFSVSHVFSGVISQINSFETWLANYPNPPTIPSTDPAGVVWNSSDGHLYIADSEINEGGSAGVWAPNHANIFETNITGSLLYNMYRTRPESGLSSDREPTGICYYPAENAYYVTNDDRKTLTKYTFSGGVSATVQEWFLTGSPFSCGDPEGVTVNPANGHIYVIDGADGGLKVVALQVIGNNLSYIPSESFSVGTKQSGPMRDAEGIAYRPSTGTLFIMTAQSGGIIFEWTLGGTLLTTYDISGFSPSPLSPQGLSFGPRSTNSSYESLYIADGGLDNNDVGQLLCRDGMIYEAKIGLDDTPLPVELVSFTAEIVENNVRLKWKTESEINNLGFEILRSESEIGDYVILSSFYDNVNLVGMGNSSIGNEYSYIDEIAEPGKIYWYKLADIDYSGTKTFHEPYSIAVPPENSAFAFELYPNYPNPFNPSTTIKFEVHQVLSGGIKLVIYNNIGQAIKEIDENIMSPGVYELQWDGKNTNGTDASGGVYFANIVFGPYSKTIRMSLVK